ncbi:GntR family transcriptional regulator [Nocardioides cavernaquae]|uniref:GntR family transcriptional regulator n=1 Tax=Nocardioides cavernaquae TaxID=2321396 RepID=A0A3A5HBJ6_9ACTN|nr:GntR family transcriptional regulator [Nocardioides cavernaquae]
MRASVHSALRQRIIGLDLMPGARLVERDLAAELGVSRVPLREALQLLESEGLVVLVPRQGAIVAPFTADDVRHLFEVREYVEVPAAGLAATRRTPDDIAQMRASVDSARHQAAAGDELGAAEANADFHMALVEATGNPLLISTAEMLDVRMRWLFHLTRQRNALSQCQEHDQILRAIEAGDDELAEQLARAHVLSGKGQTIEMAADWAQPAIDPVEATRSRRRG